MDPPIAWEEIASSHQAWELHLHSWDMLPPLLASYNHSRERRCLDVALDVACDWARSYPSLDTPSRFAWYDMAIAARAYRLAYILDAACRLDDVPDEQIELLLGSAQLHAEALADDERFAAHSNHGFYFAAGQLAFARRFQALPGMEEQREQALGRLRRVLEVQFTSEGVHREHSPDYHRMVLQTFEGLVSSGLLEAEEHLEMIGRAEEALAWFVLPNGELAMFGDTVQRRVIQSTACEHTRSEAMRFVRSGGEVGTPPDERFRAFPESGYVVFRDGWPRSTEEFEHWSYLAQICCFHSRVHKHADDLSVVWYDRGRELLVDAGKFGFFHKTTPGSELAKAGFFYGHPKRVYVESTEAHNTVEIDGRSYQRRTTPPYGSALLAAGENGGLSYSVCRARQFETVDHVRVLVFRPGEWLMVVDWLGDTEGQPHDFTQHFHFSPELELVSSEGSVELTLPERAPELHLLPLLPAKMLPPVRGRGEPMRGWISRVDGELVPCLSTGFSVSNTPTAAFAALLAFEHTPPRPLASDISPEAAEGHLRWETDDRVHTLGFRSLEEATLELDYRIAVP